MGDFSNNEKIIYSLKYALNLTTKDPTAAPGFEFLSAPRIFPSSIPVKDLLKVGEGDIDSEGKNSNGTLVDLTAPYDTVKLYKIIDPITNKVSNKNVNDILGTSFNTIKQVYEGASTQIPTASNFSTGTVYRYWFHDFNTPPYNGTTEPAFNWKGIRLAYAKSTPGNIVSEGDANYVPHIGLYLGVPLLPISNSSWANGIGDSISYEHDKSKGRYLLGLLGLSNTFKTRILKNDYSTIKTDTASANEGDTWFTNPTYGLLSFYGIKDTKASGNSGIGVAANECPRLSFCRYIGETVDFSNLGSGGGSSATTGGASVTIGAENEDAPTDGSKGDLFFDTDDKILKINTDGTEDGWTSVGEKLNNLTVNNELTVGSGINGDTINVESEIQGKINLKNIEEYLENNNFSLVEGNKFGEKVAISGDYLLTKITQASGSSLEHYGLIYKLNENGDNSITTKWILDAILYVPDNNNKIMSLALDGNYAIISKEGSTSREPSVYVFERRSYLTGQGYTTFKWGMEDTNNNIIKDGVRRIPNTELRAWSNDTWNQYFLDFGYSVAIKGNYIAVGSPHFTNNSGRIGKVYIFKSKTESSSPFAVWGDAPNPSLYPNATYRLANTAIGLGSDYLSTAPGSDYGFSIAISENYIIVGARGAECSGFTSNGLAFIYKNNSTSSSVTFDLVSSLVASDRNDYARFGFSVSITDTHAIIGANHSVNTIDTTTYSSSGAAYIFKKNNDDTWGQQDTTINTLRKENVKILPSIDATDASLKSNGFFGYDVAILQDKALVSAIDERNTPDPSYRFVYIFKKNDNDEWGISVDSQNFRIQNNILSDNNFLHSQCSFGNSISISDLFICIGNPNVNNSKGQINIYNNGTNSYQSIKISTNGEDSYFRSGNFGIGKKNPEKKLDVNGDINFTGNLYKNNNLFSTGGSSLWTSSSNNIYYNTGSVGIGTNPKKELHVQGDIKFTGNLYQGDNLFSAGGSSLWTSSSNNIYYNTGSIGIGTNDPKKELHVEGDIKFTGNLYQGDNLFSGGSSGGGGSTITRKGQVLEVLLGRAESGETVEVESGTYNFAAPASDPSSDGTIGTTLVKIASSELTYNAPEGTERIFYEYRIRGGYGSNHNPILYYHLHIDGEPFGNEERIQAHQQRNMGLIQSIITKSDLESKGLNFNSSLNIYYKMRTNYGTFTLLNSGGNKTRLDDYIKVTAIGEQTSSGGGGGGGGSSTVTKKGQTLETLVGVFDGRTVEVESGTYTLKDVTAIQKVDNVWVDLEDTDIDYKPPAGTKQVYIRYTVAVDDDGMYLMRPSFRLLIDGNIYEGQAIIEQVHDTPNMYDSTTKNRSFVLDINGTNDIANGFLESWNTIKKIKLQVNSPGSRVNYNRTRKISGTKLVKPSIKIVAIGESTITTGGGGGGSSGGGSATNVKYKMIKDYKKYDNVPNIQFDNIPRDNYIGALNIPELDISITPNLDNSLINVRWVINFEAEVNTTFKVVRFIGSDGFVIANNDNVEESGIATSSFDGHDNGSTPHQLTLEVFDEPNVTSEVIYKIYVVGAANNNNTRWFALNGTGVVGAHVFDEKLISSVFAIEYDQHNVGGGGSTSTNTGGSPWNISNGSISYNTSNNKFAIKDYDDPNITFSKVAFPNPNGIGLYLAGSSGHVDNLKIPHIYTSFPDYAGLSHLNFTCQSDFIWYNHANVNHDNNSGAHTERMRLKSNGNVGIGTNDPVCNLEVKGSTSLAMTTRGYLNSSGYASTSSSTNNAPVTIKATGGYVWATSAVIVTSDERIKENIIEVNDNLALKKVRDISCCWYNYKDKVIRGDDKVLGFIAQQVKEHLPEAVSIQKSIIPNEMKKLENVSWNETKMSSNDLQDVSGIKYRFYVSDDLSGNEKEIDLIGQNDNSFVFDQSYNYVFCYGKEVDDFHTLDKQKLFALNFSATQEIDRLQQQQLIDISQNNINIETLKIENSDLKNQINIIKQQNQTLIERLEAIEKRLQDANI